MNDPGRVFLTQLAGEWVHTRHENFALYLKATVPAATGCCGSCVIQKIEEDALKARMTMELQPIGIKWVYRGFDKKIEAHVCIGQTFQFWDGLHGHDTLETCEFDPWTQTLTRMWTPGKKHHRPDGLVKATYRFTANGDLEITTTFNPTGVTFKAYWRKCTGHPVQLQCVQPGQAAQPQYVQPQYTQPVQPQYAQPTQPVQPQYTQPAQPQYAQPVQPQYTQPVQPQYAQPVQPQYGQTENTHTFDGPTF